LQGKIPVDRIFKEICFFEESMKFTDEISKSAKLSAIIIILTGILFALLSFVFDKVAFAMPLLMAVIIAVVVFRFIDGFGKQIKLPLETIEQNTRNLTENFQSKIAEVTDAPTELAEINKLLKNLSGKVGDILRDLNDQKNELTEENKNNLQIVKEITESAFSAKDLNIRIAEILKKSLEFCSIEACYLFFRDEKNESFIRRNYYDGEAGSFDAFFPFDPQYRLFTRILKSSIPEYILNLPDNENLPEHVRDWAEKNDVFNLYCIPIHSGDIPFGILMLSLPETREFERGQSLLLQLSADLIGNFFREEIRINENLNLSTVIELENSIYAALYKTKNMNEACGEIIRTFGSLFSTDWGAVYYYEPGKEQVRFIAMSLKDPLAEPKLTIIPYTDSAIEWISNNNKSRVEDDLSMMEAFNEDSIYMDEHLTSRIIAPVYYEGRLIGAAACASEKPSFYKEEQVISLEDITPVIGAVVQSAFSRDDFDNTINKLEKSGGDHDKFFRVLGHELRNPQPAS
jgi:transcriptional regulator with GAF, ATPase, and Fis domain